MAQLVAHLHGMQGVRGSSPLTSTNNEKARRRAPGLSSSSAEPGSGNLVATSELVVDD